MPSAMLPIMGSINFSCWYALYIKKTQQRIDRQAQKSQTQKVQHQKREGHREINCDYADIESNGLHRMKAYKGAFVDQQEDQSREPSRDVTKQAGDVFLK